MKDPYRILGVKKSATAEEIKAAYRKLAREMHPDLDPGNPWAEDEFKELSAAYDLLSDEKKRGQYERGEIDANGNKLKPDGRHQRKSSSSSGKPFDWYFKQKAEKQKAGRRINGANVTYNLKVDFAEAVKGCEKEVSLTTGKRINVKVPAGTDNGQSLRLKGQGTPGINGGQDGDALVEIEVSPHPQFTKKGLDLHIDVPVSLPEAILGGKIEVPTIDGHVAVNVPANSSSGTKLRLKGKGVKMPKAEPGDQYVTIKIILPPTPDDDLIKWAKKNAYTVRKSRAKN